MSSQYRCWRRPLAVALSICLLHSVLLYQGSAVAADTDVDANVLTLADALTRAQAQNLRLKVSSAAVAAAVAAATAARAQAARPANPELSLAYENVAGSGAYAGTDSAETTLAISQAFGGGRRARAHVAAVELALAQDAQSVQRLELAADTTRRFIAVVAAQEKLALAQRAEVLAVSTRDDLDKRAAAARAPIAERNRARMAYQRARLFVGRAEADLLLARQQLAALWRTGEKWRSGEKWNADENAGERGTAASADFSRASGDLFALPPITDDDTLLAALERSPLHATLRNNEKLRAAEVAHARALGRPPVTASVGLRAFSNKDSANTGDNALLFGVSLPIPLFNRNRGAIAASEARLDAQRAENSLTQREAELRLLALTAELKQAGAEADTLRNITLPLANEALEQTRYGFERGRFSWLELASVQQELIDTETTAIAAAANYHTLLADLEALTGLTLIASSRSTGDTP